MYIQSFAPRIPIRYGHGACLLVTTNFNDENDPPLQNQTVTVVEAYISFDPVDPYHRSGLPKRKVLYGPGGYLGNQKDWEQSTLSKMAEKCQLLGNQVVNYAP